MSKVFWIGRFLAVFAVAFVVIGSAQLLRGHTLSYSMIEGFIWSAISATIFTSIRMYHAYRGKQCGLCRDTPGTHSQQPTDRLNSETL